MSGSKIPVSSLFLVLRGFLAKIVVENNELVLGNYVFQSNVQRN